MAATRDEIAQWFREGLGQGATHLIVVCDTFDYEDYPVYVMPGESSVDVAREHGKDDHNGVPTLPNADMEKVMEVYALHLGMDAQLAEDRAFNFDGPPAQAATA